ncbi:lysophospholipid acyltransferase family protein [Brumicola pallidula]|jgi:KDO2-lipid IV(A) lauroyltransferase|nr:lysophospholipid acyltransferase family protein [Glaciecola pallidula]
MKGLTLSQRVAAKTILVIIFLFKLRNRATRKKIAFGIARIIFALSPKTRKRSINNLRIAMPDQKSDDRIRYLAVTAYQYIVFGVLENFWFEDIEYTFEMDAATKALITSGGPLSIATMHLSCYEAVPFALQKLTGRVTTLSRVPKFAAGLHSVYAKNGVCCVDKSQAGAFLALAGKMGSNGVVCLHSDHFGSDTELDFFQLQTGAPAGPAMLSAYAKTPLLIAYAVLQKDNTYIIHIETVSEFPIGQSPKAFQFAMQAIYRQFESIILQYPEQWCWFYKRWR